MDILNWHLYFQGKASSFWQGIAKSSVRLVSDTPKVQLIPSCDYFFFEYKSY